MRKLPTDSVLMNVVPSSSDTAGTARGRMRRKAEDVAAFYNVSVSDLLGTTRKKLVMRARVDMYRYARDMGLSYPQIGKIFGRDHTTIMKVLQGHKKKGGGGCLVSDVHHTAGMVIDSYKGA